MAEGRLMNSVATHKSHCCAIHGCKYGDNDACPVVGRVVTQDYICESCADEGVTDIDELLAVVKIDCCDNMKRLLEDIYNLSIVKEFKVCPFCLKEIQ